MWSIERRFSVNLENLIPHRRLEWTTFTIHLQSSLKLYGYQNNVQKMFCEDSSSIMFHRKITVYRLLYSNSLYIVLYSKS